MLALTGSLLVTTPLAAQAPPDLGQWTCSLCPFQDIGAADTNLGSSYVSTAAPRYADGTGYDRAGLYLDADLEARWGDDNGDIEVSGRDLGLAARSATARYRSYTNGSLTLTHRAVPAYYFFDTVSLLRPDGDGILVPPAGWQPAATTDGFAIAPGDLLPRSLAVEWQQTALALALTPAPRWRLSLGFERQSKAGHRAQGGAHFSQATLLPRTVDATTDTWRGAVRYATEVGGIELAGQRQRHNNRRPALTWRSPFIVPPGAMPSELAPAPDHSVGTVALGSYLRLPAATQISVSLQRGWTRQDDDLLAYSPNAAVAQTLPRTSAAALIETRALQLAASGRPTPRLRLRVRLQDEQRRNETPVALWERVIADSFASGAPTPNRQFGWHRRRLQLDARWRAHRTLTVTAGVAHRETDRTDAVVFDLREQQSFARLDWRATRWLRTQLRLSGSERDPRGRDPDRALALGANPRHRAAHVAYRYRYAAELALAMEPPGGRWSLGVAAGFRDDDYAHSELGLQDADAHFWRASLDHVLSSSTTTFITAHGEYIDERQDGSANFTDSDWTHASDDRFVGARVGLRFAPPAGRITIAASAGVTRARTALRTRVDGSGDSAFPTLRNDAVELRLRADLRFNTATSGYVELIYDTLAGSDWAIDGLEVTALPTVVSLGADANDHHVRRLAIGVSRRFGRR